MMRFEWVPIVAGTLLLLAACGDRAPQEVAPTATRSEAAAQSEPTEALPAAKTTAPGAAVGKVPAVMTPDLRDATTTGPQAAIELKYQVATSPAVGQPVDIDFALVPQKASPAMRLMVATSSGLSLQRSSAPALQRNVDAGAEYWYQLVVLPNTNGAFNVNIIASLGEGSQTLSRTFSIPIVVGSTPFHGDMAQKPNAQVSPNDPPTKVMPGQESR